MDDTPSDSAAKLQLRPRSISMATSERRPLIEQCTNEWQRDPKYLQSTPVESDADWLDPIVLTLKQIWAVAKGPRFQRWVILLAFATVMAIVCWRNYLSPYIIGSRLQSKAIWDSMYPARPRDTFGANKRVSLTGVTHLSSLNVEYLPRASKANPDGASKGRRLIFIGDIHGCADELEALLDKVKYKPKMDHIVAVGDMINKGPKSREVVDLLMKYGASAVRGNHEDRILLIAKEMAAGSLVAQTDSIKNTDPSVDSKTAQKAREERALAQSFSREQLDWLNSCPVILRIGNMGPLGHIVAVHAGLVPNIRLENQDPKSVMNMRIIDLDTHMPSHKHYQEGSIPWADFWNNYERIEAAQHNSKGPKDKKFQHTTVVYGHDAKRGLQTQTWTKGLDSGCVYGRKLSAWVVSDFGEERIVQVKCREH